MLYAPGRIVLDEFKSLKCKKYYNLIMKSVLLVVFLLAVSPLYSAAAGADNGEITMPREQMGLDYFIERLISLVPRESWTLFRNSVLAVLQPCLPFILPPMYLVFGDAFAPYTHWIVYSLGPLNRVATYILNIVIFLFAPIVFGCGLGMYPANFAGMIQQMSPAALLRSVGIDSITSFFSIFLPQSLAQLATTIVLPLCDPISVLLTRLSPSFWLLSVAVVFSMPFILLFALLSVPFEIPWLLLALPLSLILLIFPAPFRAVFSVMARRLIPLYRVFVTG
jgi:hypothetical protein